MLGVFVGSGKISPLILTLMYFHLNLTNCFCVYIVLEAEERYNETDSAPKTLGV